MATSAHFPTTPIQDGVAAFVETFGLAEDPFPVEPDRGTFVPIPSHATALETFRRWIGELQGNPNRPDRLAVLIGEEGSGKTRLLAELVHGMENDRQDLIRLPDVPSHRTDAQLLRAVLAALDTDPVGRTGLELRGEIRDALQTRGTDGAQVGLLIDDADFKGSQLELVRNLLRDTTGTGLWITLAGTPDLHDRMRRRRSLRGLMGPAITLDDLPADELGTLVTGRIESVRTPATPGALMPPATMSSLADWADGAPGRMLRAARAAISLAAEAGEAGITPAVAADTVRRLMIAEANEVSAEVAMATGRPVQAAMPLPDAGSSSATTQRSLWETGESV